MPYRLDLQKASSVARRITDKIANSFYATMLSPQTYVAGIPEVLCPPNRIDC